MLIYLVGLFLMALSNMFILHIGGEPAIYTG